MSDSRLRPRFLGNEKTLCNWKRGQHGTEEEPHVSACRRGYPNGVSSPCVRGLLPVPTSSFSSFCLALSAHFREEKSEP